MFHRTWTGVYGPLAGDWADPTVIIPHWKVVPQGSFAAQPGDVIAEKVLFWSDATGHVGIVVGPKQTASAASDADIAGRITISDFGFRANNDTSHQGLGHADKSVVRRYSDAP